MIEQDIAIAAADRGIPCMEPFVYSLRPGYGYRRRQQRVSPAYPGGIRTFHGSIEMNHLGQGVHAGIRAPSADRRNALARDLPQSAFEHVLYAAPGGLRLPAAKADAAVLESQCDPHKNENRGS